MSWRPGRTSTDADGLTLVELLVVLTLLAVVGSMISMAMIRGLQADAQARDRIEAFESMQIAIERMSREIRAANSSSAAHPLATADGNQIRFQVRRLDEDCLEFHYRLDGDQVTASQWNSTDGCDTLTGGSDQVLVRGIDLTVNPDVDGIFAYYDEERNELEPTDVDFDEEVAFVEIRFVRTLVHDQRPVTVNTIVGLRNR